jgi:hypothetical protein
LFDNETKRVQIMAPMNKPTISNRASTQQIAVRMPDELYAEVHALALTEDRTISDMVRQLVKSALTRRAKGGAK